MESITGDREAQAGRRRVALVALAAALTVAFFAGLLSGSVDIDFRDIWHSVGIHLGSVDQSETLNDSVLWAIRLPRVLAGLLVGGGLGIAGVALQGVFRNYLADAHLVGLAPAAGLGAVAGIALTPVGGTHLIMMGLAALGGISLALLMRRIALNTENSGQLILIGLALGLAFLAALGAIVLAWDSPRVPTFTFWVFGGLSGTTWSTLGAAAPLIVAGSVAIATQAGLLDILALGDDEARHLGVGVERVATICLVAVGVTVGGAVGLAGVVGFVGLIVPLLLRAWVGPEHRPLILLSGIGGAAMLVAIDIAARTVAAPVEIPVGLLTAIVGAPLLVWYLLRKDR